MPGIDQEIYVILFCNYCSVIMIFMLLFISWKKGPEWWTSRSPKIYYGMVLTMFVILPSINFIWSFYTICDPRLPLRDSPNENWIVLYTVICVARIIEYFTTIRKVHIHDARIFIETQKQMKETNIEQLEEFIQTGEAEKAGVLASHEQKRKTVHMKAMASERKPYMEQVRFYGEGEIRVGTSLNLNDDIYSLGFISQLSDVELGKILDILTGDLLGIAAAVAPGAA